MYGILLVKPVEKIYFKSLILQRHKLLRTGAICSRRTFAIHHNDNYFSKKDSLKIGKHYFNYGVIRPHYSTANEVITTSIKKTKTKKRKQNSKLTTNITEVSNSKSTQKNTTLPKLEKHELAAFITSPPNSARCLPTHKIEIDKNEELPVLVSADITHTVWDNPEFIEKVLASFQKFKIQNNKPDFRKSKTVDVQPITETELPSQSVTTEVDENVPVAKPKKEKKTKIKKTKKAKATKAASEASEIDATEELSLFKSLNAPLDVSDLNNATTEVDATPEKEKKAKTKKANATIVSSETNEIEARELSKQLSLSKNLNAFLNICVLNNATYRGWSVLLNYRNMCKKSPNKLNVQDIELYNILLSSFASEGNFKKILNICKVLDEDELAYTPQTYAAIFECLGRMPSTTQNLNLLRQYKTSAESKNITMNRIMDESLFVRDQRERTLAAIRKVDESFNPIYTPPNIFYNNPLLETLNRNIKPIEEAIDLSYNPQFSGSNNSGSKYGISDIESLKQLAVEQMDIEMQGKLTIPSIAKMPSSTYNVEFCRKKLKELYSDWKLKVTDAFKRDLNSIKHKTFYTGMRSVNIHPYISVLEVDEYVNLLMSEINHLAESSETYSQTTAQLYGELGKKVLQRCQIQMKKQNGISKKAGEIYEKYCNVHFSGSTTDNPRQIWQRLEYHAMHHGPSLNIKDQVWSWSVQSDIGRFLYNILLRDLKIDFTMMENVSRHDKISQVPVFYTLLRYRDKHANEEVKVHPTLMRLYRGSQPETLTFSANLVPMLCPPVPWTSPNNGAYLVNHSDLIRLPSHAMQQIDRIKNTNPTSLYPALDSLNQLASIPWKVNTEVLDVIIEVFNNGGSAKLDVPQPSSAIEFIKAVEVTDDMEKSEKSKLYAKNYQEKCLVQRKQAEMYSLWCDALYRLSLANYFRNKTFWLPHNMDFRGRVYPIPPHLNHLGSDLSRCLLVFHEAKPLGKDGFRWLKLHCINLTGLKKKNSIDERLQYAEEVMDDILDSADNPLTGRMWWSNSDEPWQTLACCMEIAHVSRCKDPASYMSHYPIHQDGSCNGLQHYAALGRDKIGAVSVNLAASARPQDVYSAVAVKVEAARKLDAKNGIQIADILEGFISRKVIKQTVMTTVYGVTQYGARLQIERQLEYIENFPKEFVKQGSCYLTKQTFESLRAMFTSAKEIQDWFTQCARLISTTRMQVVEWVTPLGLPVVQPYVVIKQNLSAKCMHNVESIMTDLYERPNTVKQKNAFPPNFIHSLDSSHMMLTSLNCEKAGFTFMSVHDCFWTHACTVSDMNKICRDQFVLLHSQPILEDLSEFFCKKYGYSEENFDGNDPEAKEIALNNVLKKLPSRGKFKLQNVLGSVYFFS